MRIRLLLVALLALVGSSGHVSSLSPFCAGALQAQAHGQDPVMPPEGNPDHQQPPDGAFCDHSERAAHACKCHAKCVEHEDGTVTLEEDGTHCRAYCFKNHCHCPADGCQAPAAHALTKG